MRVVVFKNTISLHASRVSFRSSFKNPIRRKFKFVLILCFYMCWYFTFSLVVRHCFQFNLGSITNPLFWCWRCYCYYRHRCMCGYGCSSFLPHLQDIINLTIFVGLSLLYVLRSIPISPPNPFAIRLLHSFPFFPLYLLRVVEKFTLHIICDNCRLRNCRLFSPVFQSLFILWMLYNIQWW